MLVSLAVFMTSAFMPEAHLTSDSQELHAESLTPDDWAQVQDSIARAKHVVRENQGGFVAHNPRQDWTIEFDSVGMSVTPESDNWTWGLELVAFGFSDQLTKLSKTCVVHAHGGRISYDWGSGLEEWYINDQRGLEHGFIIQSRPTGIQNGPLEFQLRVKGPLQPTVSTSLRDIQFTDQREQTLVRYSGLKAFDSTGRDLSAWFESAPGGFRIFVDETGAVYPVTIDPLAEQGYLEASNQDAEDFFGSSVAVDGDTLVVGAPGESSDGTGSTDNSASDAGAAYVFTRTGTPAKWNQQAYLKASNAEANDLFGTSVAISGDSIVVGAINEDSSAVGINGNELDNSSNDSGAAYVFVRIGTDWSQQAYLKPSNTGAMDSFGAAVGISGDTILIGSPHEDSAATGIGGNQSDNTASNSGATYVFTRTGTNWSQEEYLKASNTDAGDLFGSAVGVADNTAIVGSPDEDSIAVGINGNESDGSAMESGAAYIYVRSGTNWSQQAYVKASNSNAGDHFGSSVATVSNTAAVGAPHERSNAVGVDGDEANNDAVSSGAAYVFERSGTTWSQAAYLKASNTEGLDFFGSSVALAEGLSLVYAVVGAPGEDSQATGVNGTPTGNSVDYPQSGAAYLFEGADVPMMPTSWTHQAYIKASRATFLSEPPPANADDEFGAYVSASGTTIVVGAAGQNASTSQVDTGATYVFDDLQSPVFFTSNFCSGDGGDQMGCTPCPCSNEAPVGTIGGCLNSNGTSARLWAEGDPSVSLPPNICTDLRFSITGAPPFAQGVLLSGSALAPSNMANPCFGTNNGVQSLMSDGLRCAVMNILRHGNRPADQNGDIGVAGNPFGGEGAQPAGIAANSGFISGQVRYFQLTHREDIAAGCMRGLNSSQAIEVTFTP